MFGGAFRMRWYGHLLLSIVITAIAVWMHSGLVRVQQERQDALANPVPAPVALAEFRKDRDVHLAGEVHVLGRIDPEFNAYLVEEKSGADAERLMFVLIDGADDATVGVARAAILIPSAQEQRFRDWLLDSNPKEDQPGSTPANGLDRQLLRFNGRVDPSPQLGNLAEAALAEAGLTPAREFIFIEPFLDGREVALAADPAFSIQLTAVVGAIGMVFLFAAISSFDRSRTATRKQPAPTDPEAGLSDISVGRRVRLARERLTRDVPDLEETSAEAPPGSAANWLRSPILLMTLAFLGLASASGVRPSVVAVSVVPALVVAAAIWTVVKAIVAALRDARKERSTRRAGIFGKRKRFGKAADRANSAETTEDTGPAPVRPGDRKSRHALQDAADEPRRVPAGRIGISASDVRRGDPSEPTRLVRQHA